MGKYAKLYSTKDTSDPEVQIFGMGVWKLSQLKSNVQKKIEDVNKWADAGDFEKVAWALNPKSTSPLITMVMSIKDVEQELEALAKLVKK